MKNIGQDGNFHVLLLYFVKDFVKITINRDEALCSVCDTFDFTYILSILYK